MHACTAFVFIDYSVKTYLIRQFTFKHKVQTIITQDTHS